jgi:hypothetical protein
MTLWIFMMWVTGAWVAGWCSRVAYDRVVNPAPMTNGQRGDET